MAENGSVVIKIKGDDNDFKSKLKSLGGAVSTTMKATAAAVGAASAGIAALGTACINAFADYEQLAGGVETLFKDSAELVHSYADNAYKTAGMSANAYMETVTSFSASLLQSLGGDTEAAAKAADRAITDMSDNANKMGTSMESIIQTYQSLSRGNFAMLDNLKLGYGGTKEELERLLKDAEDYKATMGEIVDYDINDFSDIVSAIGAIQDEMGITGTTAKEANTTIQGSIASMKASWTNLMVGMADDTMNFDILLSNFIESIGTVAENLLPRIGIVIEGMGKLVAGLAPKIASALPTLTNELLPELVELGVQAIGSLVQGIQENGDSLAEGALSIVSTLGAGIVELLPMIADTAASLMVSLADGISENLPEMVPAAVETIASLVENLTANAGDILQAGISIIAALGEGIINALPNLIQTVPQIVTNIADVINQNATRLLLTAAELIVQLGIGLIRAIPTLVANIPAIIEAIVKAFFAFQWVNLGSTLISAVSNGVRSMGGAMRQAAADVSEALAGKLRELPTRLLQIGKDVVAGLANGIKGAIPNLLKAAREMSANLLANVKSVFKIQSPSKVMRDEVGAMLVAGVAEGIEDNASVAVDAVKDLGDDILAKAKGISNFTGLFTGVEAEDISGKDLISNLESQMEAIRKYRDNLEALKEKGVSGSLFEELAGMGPDAANEIEALNKLTEKQLNEYIALYEEKKAAAEEIAKGFFSVGEEAAAELTETTADGASEGVAAQEEPVVEATKELAEAAKEEIAGYQTDFETIGENLMDGVAKGVRDGQSGVVNAIARALRAAVRAAKKAMDINSPSRVMAKIGDYMAQGVGVGWSDRMEEVNASIGNSLSDGLENRMANAYARMKAVMTDGMNRLSGDIAVQAKGATNYTTNTTHTEEGDFVVHIDKIINDGKGTVTGMMEEFEFVRRQKALAKGGA